MNDKLQERLRKVEDEHAEEVVATGLVEHRQTGRDRAMFVLGGINIAGKVAAALDSDAIKALITFQEEKMHEALGFETFVQFLNDSEYAPMSKTQFYDRKAILEKEGERLFDLLTELGVSIRKRKLLGKGNVEISGDSVIVRDGDEESTIDIKDRARLIEVVTTIVDAKLDLQKQAAKKDEAIAKHDDRVRELYGEIDELRAARSAEFAEDDHSLAMVAVGLSFTQLRTAVEAMTTVERQQFGPRDLERIAGWISDLSVAFGRGEDWTTAAPSAASAADTTDDIDAVLNRALDEDNDAELAASI